MTDPLGQSQILPYLTGLSSKGVKVTILSCEKKRSFLKNKDRIEQKCAEANIIWEYVFYSKKPPILSTFYDLHRMKKKAMQLHRKNKFSVIHCRTILATIIGFPLQKRGAKLIFDIRGFWADERVDGKLWNLNKPHYRIVYNYFKTKERKAYLNANHIVTLTQNAKEHLKSVFKIQADKISIVPCTVDLNHFQLTDAVKKKSHTIRKQLDLDAASPLVCYSGSLGTRYLVEKMLLCFKEIKEHFQNSKLLLVTHSDTSQVSKIAKELNIDDSIVLTSTTYEEIPNYIALADIAIYFIYEGKSGKAVSPTKQAEFLSLGVPILTNAGIGDSKTILEENGGGIVIDNYHLASFQRVVKEIPLLLDKPKAEIINIAKENFNLEDGINTYHKVYSSLC